MTLDQFDAFVGDVLLLYAAGVAVLGLLKFLAQRRASSAERTTVPGRSVASSAVVAGHTRQPLRAATADEPRVQSGAAATIPATEDSGGGEVVVVPASEADRLRPTPSAQLITQPREDPAVLGRDRALPWSW